MLRKSETCSKYRGAEALGNKWRAAMATSTTDLPASCNWTSCFDAQTTRPQKEGIHGIVTLPIR